jgi:hypothetical protein
MRELKFWAEVLEEKAVMGLTYFCIAILLVLLFPFYSRAR